MKTLEDYMKLNYRLEFEPDEDEGGYVAYFPELPGCITTWAPGTCTSWGCGPPPLWRGI